LPTAHVRLVQNSNGKLNSFSISHAALLFSARIHTKDQIFSGRLVYLKLDLKNKQLIFVLDSLNNDPVKIPEII